MCELPGNSVMWVHCTDTGRAQVKLWQVQNISACSVQRHTPAAAVLAPQEEWCLAKNRGYAHCSLWELLGAPEKDFPHHCFWEAMLPHRAHCEPHWGASARLLICQGGIIYLHCSLAFLAFIEESRWGTLRCICSERLNRGATIEFHPQKVFFVLFYFILFWPISVRLTWAIWIFMALRKSFIHRVYAKERK